MQEESKRRLYEQSDVISHSLCICHDSQYGDIISIKLTVPMNCLYRYLLIDTFYLDQKRYFKDMKLGGSIGYLLIFPIIPNLWNSDKNWARYGSFIGKGWLRILGTSAFFFITKKVVWPRLRHLKINSKLKQCRLQCCVLSSFRIIRNYWLCETEIH